MPRLKAMLTGRPPAFIDVILNFNSVALTEENLISNWKAMGHTMHFYGDDTWLKLFPTQFIKYEGTSGFYTRDIIQVDLNVSRHFEDELDPEVQKENSQEWSILLLHYLGLDHVGHSFGPYSAQSKTTVFSIFREKYSTKFKKIIKTWLHSEEDYRS